MLLEFRSSLVLCSQIVCSNTTAWFTGEKCLVCAFLTAEVMFRVMYQVPLMVLPTVSQGRCCLFFFFN